MPNCPVSHGLLALLGEPMMSTSLVLPQDSSALTEADAIRQRLEGSVDLILDGGTRSPDPTTVVDLTGEVPNVTRPGLVELEL